MPSSQGQVIQDAAALYEAFFVPALFGEWAPRVAEAAQIRPGQQVLDVACGTGVLTREAARRAGVPAHGLDVNASMLAVARRHGPELHWHEAPADALPFEAHRFDAVVSQFGLMFFPDRPGALRELWRVLRPGGRMAVAVWGALEDTPGYAALTQLLARLFGPDIADELRAPFCLGDRAELAQLFNDAGIVGAHVETVPGRCRFPSIRDWIHVEVRSWTLADKLDDVQLERLQQEAARALARFADAQGRVSFESPAHIVTATKRAL